MNYNVVALICMITGIVLFYIVFFEVSLIMGIIIFVFFEVMAALLFLLGEVNSRYADLEKRLKKLEEKEN